MPINPLRMLLAACLLTIASDMAHAQGDGASCQDLEEGPQRAKALGSDEVGPGEAYLRCFPLTAGSQAVRDHVQALTARDRCAEMLQASDVETVGASLTTAPSLCVDDLVARYNALIEQREAETRASEAQARETARQREAALQRRRASFSRYDGTRLSGTVLLQGATSSEAECFDACVTREPCVAFTRATRSGACTLWGSVVTRAAFAGAVSASAIALPPPAEVQQAARPPIASPPQIGGQVAGRRLDNTDLPGADFSRIDGTTFAGCQSACASLHRCAAVTFDTVNRACFLKSTVPSGRPYSGAVSWVKGGAAQRQVRSGGQFGTMLPGIDFPGGDLQRLNGLTYDVCRSRCAATSRCAGLTFNTRHSACFLKYRLGRGRDFADAISWRK